jgi:hypothetical protein
MNCAYGLQRGFSVLSWEVTAGEGGTRWGSAGAGALMLLALRFTAYTARKAMPPTRTA